MLFTTFVGDGYVEAQKDNFERISQEFSIAEEMHQVDTDNISSVIENISDSVVGIVSSLSAEGATGINPNDYEYAQFAFLSC
jgi:hypothetical protein